MSDTAAITPRQQRILDVIAAAVRDRGYPPTVREIGEAVGLTSSSSVHAQLANLERMGLLHKDPTKPRAVALDRPRADAVAVPHAGPDRGGRAGPGGRAVRGIRHRPARPRRRGGPPRAHRDGRLDDRRRHLRRRCGGACTRRTTRDDGDIVAALLPGPAEDEATIKRLGHDGERVMLIPENPTLKPFEMLDGRILGKVVAVMRKL